VLSVRACSALLFMADTDADGKISMAEFAAGLLTR
jgi:hypothetical protein